MERGAQIWGSHATFYVREFTKQNTWSIWSAQWIRSIKGRRTFEETPQNNSVLTAYTPEYSFLSQSLPFITRRKWHLAPVVLSPRRWQTMPMG